MDPPYSALKLYRVAVVVSNLFRLQQVVTCSLHSKHIDLFSCHSLLLLSGFVLLQRRSWRLVAHWAGYCWGNIPLTKTKWCYSWLHHCFFRLSICGRVACGPLACLPSVTQRHSCDTRRGQPDRGLYSSQSSVSRLFLLQTNHQKITETTRQSSLCAWLTLVINIRVSQSKAE